MKPSTLAQALAAPLAVLALTAAIHRGEGFQVNFPDGWSAPKMDADGITTSTEPGDSGANCNIENKKLATLDGLTQAELNEQYDHLFSPAEWSDFLSLPAEDIAIIAGEVRRVGELRQQVATLKVTFDATEVSVSYGFYTLPGRVLMTGCYVQAEFYPAYAALYESVISSTLPF